MPEPELLLVVDTNHGQFVRRIMPASLLRTDIPQGYAAEHATRDAAAVWGLPDFVFRPAVIEGRTRRREVGDLLVVAGALAACIQVKSREAPSDVSQRERQWLDKKVSTALRQASGSIKTFRRAGTLSLSNERGREITVAAADKRWLSVVVLDHPGLTGYIPARGGIVLLRRDWEFLFSQLKSTYAVLQYLEHVSSNPPIELGTEHRRYFEVALASVDKEPEPPDMRITRREADVTSFPLFPLEPARNGEIMRWILEDLAAIPPSTNVDQDKLVEVLAMLDAIPVAARSELSTTVLNWLNEVRNQSDGVHWRLRRIVSAKENQVILGVCNRPYTAGIQEAFTTAVRLRHQEHLERTPERRSLTSVGVLLTPRLQGWDTTMSATGGDQRLDEESRRALERLWGTWDAPGTP